MYALTNYQPAHEDEVPTPVTRHDPLDTTTTEVVEVVRNNDAAVHQRMKTMLAQLAATTAYGLTSCVYAPLQSDVMLIALMTSTLLTMVALVVTDHRDGKTTTSTRQEFISGHDMRRHLLVSQFAAPNQPGGANRSMLLALANRFFNIEDFSRVDEPWCISAGKIIDALSRKGIIPTSPDQSPKGDTCSNQLPAPTQGRPNDIIDVLRHLAAPPNPGSEQKLTLVLIVMVLEQDNAVRNAFAQLVSLVSASPSNANVEHAAGSMVTIIRAAIGALVEQAHMQREQERVAAEQVTAEAELERQLTNPDLGDIIASVAQQFTTTTAPKQPKH